MPEPKAHKRVSVVLSAADHTHAKTLAAIFGVTISRIVRHALADEDLWAKVAEGSSETATQQEAAPCVSQSNDADVF